MAVNLLARIMDGRRPTPSGWSRRAAVVRDSTGPSSAADTP